NRRVYSQSRHKLSADVPESGSECRFGYPAHLTLAARYFDVTCAQHIHGKRDEHRASRPVGLLDCLPTWHCNIAHSAGELRSTVQDVAISREEWLPVSHPFDSYIP